jgi:hypothetical protein
MMKIGFSNHWILARFCYGRHQGRRRFAAFFCRFAVAAYFEKKKAKKRQKTKICH